MFQNMQPQNLDYKFGLQVKVHVLNLLKKMHAKNNENGGVTMLMVKEFALTILSQYLLK